MQGLLLTAALLVAPAPAPQDPPAHDGWVTDDAGLLSAAEERDLSRRLAAYQEQSGTDVAVLTVESLGGRPLEDYAIDAAREWGLGGEGVDDGVLILVARDERKIRIEVGSGIEGELTDLVSGRIIDLVMVPEFRAGRYGEGIRKGAELVVAALGGDLSGVPEPPQGGRRGVGSIFGAVFFLLFMLMAVAGSRRGGSGRGGGGGFLTGMLLGSAMGSSWRGGVHTGGFGGGGFGGGGFGGFGGGGGFSGGGASGGW